MRPQILLSVSLLTTPLLVTGQNAIFKGLSGACHNCYAKLEKETCKGDYRTLEVANCICGTTGTVDATFCSRGCYEGEPERALDQWWAYCAVFFKTVCKEAKKELKTDLWEERCGEEAIEKYETEVFNASTILPPPPVETGGKPGGEESGSLGSVVRMPGMVMLSGLGLLSVGMVAI